MTENQKKKSKFRASKEWKLKKLYEKKRAGGKDEITLKPLYKGWTLHHEDLNPDNYEKMNSNFLCCNKKTHEVVHWLFTYYKTDVTILDRLKAELDKMKALNKP